MMKSFIERYIEKMQMMKYKDFVRKFRKEFKKGTNVLTEIKEDDIWTVFVKEGTAILVVNAEIKYAEDFYIAV